MLCLLSSTTLKRISSITLTQLHQDYWAAPKSNPWFPPIFNQMYCFRQCSTVSKWMPIGADSKSAHIIFAWCSIYLNWLISHFLINYIIFLPYFIWNWGERHFQWFLYPVFFFSTITTFSVSSRIFSTLTVFQMSTSDSLIWQAQTSSSSSRGLNLLNFHSIIPTTS